MKFGPRGWKAPAPGASEPVRSDTLPASAPAAENVIRLNSLTGLRWWAAFAVFAHHMTNLAPLPVHDALRLGNAGVTFFFILSGFVLTWSARPGVRSTTFWWRRFARIWPAHFVALLLAIPVFYSFSPDPEHAFVKPVSVGILLLSVVLLQGWSRDPAILFSGNPAAWTLTCEAFFYALHPAINRLTGRLGRGGALWLCVAVVGAAFGYRMLVLLWPQSGLGDLPWPIIRITEFILGMGLARALLCGWRVTLKPLWCYLAGGAALVVIGFGERWSSTASGLEYLLVFSNEIIIVIFGVTIAAIAGRDLRGGPSLLRSRPLVALGDMSYAFYLVHATIVYAIVTVVGKQEIGWSNVGWYGITLVVAIVAAALLHYGLERPVEKRMRRWWDARPACGSRTRRCCCPRTLGDAPARGRCAR